MILTKMEIIYKQNVKRTLLLNSINKNGLTILLTHLIIFKE
jgi:hypothetical protein